MKDSLIDMNIDDALIEKPHGFTIESRCGQKKHFYLYPLTFGKLHLLNRHMKNLDIDVENLSVNPHLEAIRVVNEHKAEVCKIFAYHTLKKKKELFNNKIVEDNANFFEENASDEELASLLILILSKDDLESYKRHLGITEEGKRLNEVLSRKGESNKKKNNFSFGGKSIYGTLLDIACERYGWSYDYVMWGISFINLQLMLADRIQDVYLTDEEKKYVPSNLLQDGATINADDKSNKEVILSMDWK